MTDKEIYSFLDNNENVTAQLYGDVLEVKHRMEMDTDADVIRVYESDDGLGIIIDAYCGEDNVGTATFWYDDYNS
jgi:hypothetical protein